MRTWSLHVPHQFLRLALRALHGATASASAAFKSRATLQLENLALRHHLVVLRSSVKRPKLTSADRLLRIKETRTSLEGGPRDLAGALEQPSDGRREPAGEAALMVRKTTPAWMTGAVEQYGELPMACDGIVRMAA